MIVFCPGSLCDQALFAHQIDALRSAGHSVTTAALSKSASIAQQSQP